MFRWLTLVCFLPWVAVLACNAQTQQAAQLPAPGPAQQTQATLPEAPQPQAAAPVARPVHKSRGLHPCPNQDPKLVPELCGALPPLPPPEKLPFLNYSGPVGLSPQKKFRLAFNNVRDPFNLASIGFFSAIDVATDAHGPYGPGIAGYFKDAGTTFTEDINGQFWSTFAVASLAGEDPHYHRMPNASIQRRVLHCFDAVVLAQSDNGHTMPNFDNLIGSPIAASINNLYVPYPQTNVKSTVDRVLVGFAFDPIGNAITEFLPDVARRVNVRVVFVQQIMNKLYQSQTGGASLQ